MFPTSKSTHESHTVCDSIEGNANNNVSFSRNFNIEETSKVNWDTSGVLSSNSAKSLYSTSSSVDSKFPLYRCVRIVPDDQDSGAFFIAVLHKLSPLNEGQMVEVTKTELPLSTDRTVKLQEEPQPEIMPSEKNLVHQQRIVSEDLDDDKVLDEQKTFSMDNQTS